MKLIDNFENACEASGKLMKNMKKSTIPAAIYTLVEFYGMFCTRKFTQGIAQRSGKKHTLVFSNVPGYVKPVYYGGQPAKRFFYLGVGTGNLATAIVIVSV